MDEERKLQTVEGSENKAVIPLCCVFIYSQNVLPICAKGGVICLARPPPPLMQIIRRLPAAEPGCRT